MDDRHLHYCNVKYIFDRARGRSQDVVMPDLIKPLAEPDLAIISALERELGIKIPPAEDFGGLFVPPGGFIVEGGRVAGLGFVGEPIYDVPDRIAELERLSVLVLADCGIEELPETLGSCPALRELHVWGNSLSAFPAAVWGCRSLERVNMSENSWQAFAPVTGSLPSVRELDLSQNLLVEV